MTRLFTFVAVVAAVGAVTGAVLLAASGGSANASAKRNGVTTIRFRAHEVLKPRFIDSAPPAGPSTGDEVTEKEILYSDGHRIGYDLLHATAITANRATQTVDVIAEACSRS